MSLVVALSRPRVRVLAMLLALTAAFAGASAKPAHAAPGANQTVLTFDPLIPIALDIAKVQLRPIGASRVGSAGIYYRVTRSNATTKFVGTTRHQGGFEFVIGKSVRVGLRNPTVTIGKNGEGSLTAEPVVQGMVIPYAIPVGKLTMAAVSATSKYVTATYRLRVEKAYADLVNGSLGVNVLPVNLPWATLETRITR